ncbi:MAG: HIT family protein [bacterium]|nr:HIT family protein [bacterium]
MSIKECVFCKIIRRELEGYIVFEDDLSIAFLDIRPLTPGHCLLVPKEHYETIMDVPEELIGPIFKNAKLISKAIELGLSAQGIFIGINNRISQSVPHLHIHIVPRNKNDGLRGFFWPRYPYRDKETILDIQSRIRNAIEKMLV